MAIQAGRRKQQDTSDSCEAASLCLGARIKSARIAAQLTLSELAERAGFSESTLSRIENEKTELGAHKLYRLADALGIDVGALFADQKKSINSTLFSVSRKGESPGFKTSGFNADILSSDINAKLMQPFINTVSVESLDAAGGCQSHEGEEFLLVLSGCIALHFKGKAPTLLNEGDSIYFHGSVAHAYVNAAEKPSRILVVTSSGFARSVNSSLNSTVVSKIHQGAVQ